ncbi:MAG TPA: PHP domain-containing protein [Clostridiales bacterium]|nr:PHP domain-containing protein [Clostridiales bacterium]
MSNFDDFKVYGDYHTHTKYSDGFTTVEENLIAATKNGLSSIGFSDHGFGNPNFASLTREKAKKQKEEIDALRDKYPHLKIYQAIEADLVSVDGDLDMNEEDYELFDYVIVGVHRFAKTPSFKSWWHLYKRAFFPIFTKPSKKELAKNTATWIKMITRNKIAILAHFNSIFLAESKPVAECCAAHNVLFEINSKHLSEIKPVFEDVLKTDVKFIVSSDGHRKNEVGNFDKIKKFLENYPEALDRIVNLKPGEIEFNK